jgi:hypothetical protein
VRSAEQSSGYGRAVPRRSHKSLRRDGADRRGSGDGAASLGGQETQRTPDGVFLVSTIPGHAARKSYRCPGCQQVIAVGTAHLVVWPADDPSWVESAVDGRRHWHRSCWHRRSTRGGPGPVAG